MAKVEISSFDHAMWVIRHPYSVFVIPTFQRPYAWEDMQVHDLLDDLAVMYTKKPPMHYLAPVHVAPLRSEGDLVLWQRYTDADNPDLQSLFANGFREDERNPLDICFVIDGQQRLTTLFALYAGFSKKLTITVQGREIPRLLLNPAADHQFFKARMTGQQQIKPQGQSQKRIARLFDLASKITMTQQKALEDQNLKLLLVQVDADYGLKSFLSLNDRGRPLSVLDKLKCLWMEKDENAIHVAALHHAFGDAFRLLDHPVWGDEPFPEERFVRLLGIRAHWVCDTNCVWRDSEQLFDDYFKPKCNKAANGSRAGALIASHLEEMNSHTKALNHLAEHIAGTTKAATTPSPVIPKRFIRDDYRAFFQAWNPDNRSLAFLIRLGDLLGDNDWHTPVLRGGNEGERHQDLFRQTLDRVLSEAKRNNETQVIPVMLQEWGDRLDKEISTLHQSQPRQLSALQVVEHLDRFVFKTGKNPAGTLQAIWRTAFDKPLAKALADLQSLVDGWNYGAYFFRALLDESGWDALYGHVVGEFESAQDGKWLHGDPNFELEHTFPVDPKLIDPPKLKRYGFLDLQDYQRFSGRLGNRMFIWKPLNRAIGNNWPDIKAVAYASQSFAQTIVPPEHQRDSAINLGRTLQLDFGHFIR